MTVLEQVRKAIDNMKMHGAEPRAIVLGKNGIEEMIEMAKYINENVNHPNYQWILFGYPVSSSNKISDGGFYIK